MPTVKNVKKKQQKYSMDVKKNYFCILEFVMKKNWVVSNYRKLTEWVLRAVYWKLVAEPFADKQPVIL
jgi:hypothetical protein